MQDNIIKSAHNLLVSNFKLYAKIGIEIEFYSSVDLSIDDICFHDIRNQAKENLIIINNLKIENGLNQFEIDTSFEDPEIISNQITILKRILINKGFILEPKPFSGRPGNALHFNISLHDEEGNNIFHKKDELINDMLSYSIGGLLELLNQSMIFFAPNNRSYDRFDNSFDVPKKICWGGNNRTAALRVLKNLEQNARIEHRVAGSDCNHSFSIAAMLLSIFHGIKYKIKAPAQIYGNAFYPEYRLPSLSNSYEESLDWHNQEKVLKNYINQIYICKF